MAIGGLRLGGNGKTAVASWMVRRFLDWGFRVSLLVRPTRKTKFHGEVTTIADAVNVGDECVMLFHGLSGQARLYASRDLCALQRLSEDLADVIIVDDGLRTQGLGVSLSVMMVDPSSPANVFPSGPCRERLTSPGDFDIVWAHAAGQVKTEIASDVYSQYMPRCLVGADGEERPLSFLHGSEVVVACGVGHPESFYRTVGELNCRIKRICEFADHESFSFKRLSKPNELVITTEKDVARNGWARNVWAVRVDFHFHAGLKTLEQKMQSIVSGDG